jgi:hypothetical protein
MVSPGPSGLSAYAALPSRHSVLNHVVCPTAALSVASAPPVVPGFTIHEQARHSTPPKQVRYPTDCRFTSGCSPPRLTATQLPSITGLRPTRARTYTVQTKRPHGRTHGRRRPATHVFAHNGITPGGASGASRYDERARGNSSCWLEAHPPAPAAPRWRPQAVRAHCSLLRPGRRWWCRLG